MSKLTGALLSLGARGTIGDAITFSSWRGIAYARQKVIPANPNTVDQQSTRNVFTDASDIWKRAGPLFRAPWTRFAEGQPLTGRNAFIGQFVRDLRGDLDMTDFDGSPGAKGGIPQSLMAVTPISQGFTVDFTVPAAPTGWTLTSAIAIAIEDGAPGSLPTAVSFEADDNTAPWQVSLTGLAALTTYAVSGWLEWTKPDGTLAYGPSDTTTLTTLA